MLKYKRALILALIVGMVGLFTPFVQRTDAQEEITYEFLDETSIRDTLNNVTFVLDQDEDPPRYNQSSGSPCAQPNYITLSFDQLDRGADTVVGEVFRPVQLPGQPVNCDNFVGANIFVGNFSESGIDESQIDNILGEEEESCEERAYTEGFSGGWILCGLIDGVGGAIEGIFNWILGYNDDGVPEYCNLVVNLNDPDDSSIDPNSSCTAFDTTNVEGTWNAFRVLANAFFVVAFLYAIYQVAFSTGNNALLIRSMLPKLAAAAVLVQLSFFLSSILVGFANELGAYVTQVFDWVFRDQQEFSVGTILFGNDDRFIDFVLGSSFLLIGAVAAYFSLATIFTTLALMLVIVFVVLVARKLLILIALVLAPIAAIAWIHPQTDGFAKAWWQVFSKLLLMYPIIILLIKSGELMARATSGAGDTDFEFDMVRFVAYFAPFFLIPFTFRFAGGLIGQIAGMADAAGKKSGMIDRARQSDNQRREIRRNKTLSKINEGNFAKRAFRRAKAGMSPFAVSGTEQTRRDMLQEEAEKKQNAIADFKVGRMVSDIQSRIEDPAKAQEVSSAKMVDLYKSTNDRALQGAALRQIARTRDEDGLKKIMDHVAATGSEDDREHFIKLKNQNFGDIDSFAAHISRGNFRKNPGGNWEASYAYDQIHKLNAEAVATQKGIKGALEHAQTLYSSGVKEEQDKAVEMVQGLMQKYVNAPAGKRDEAVLDMLVRQKNQQPDQKGNPPIVSQQLIGSVQERDPNVLNYLQQAKDNPPGVFSVGGSQSGGGTPTTPPSGGLPGGGPSGGGAPAGPAPPSAGPAAPTARSFEQRKEQVVQTARQRNIPVVDERAITPETISSFETMYDIEPPTTVEQTRTTKTTRASQAPSSSPPPTKQADMSSQEIRDRLSSQQPNLGAYGPSQGRHTPEAVAQEFGGRHDQGGEAQSTTSEGRRLRQSEQPNQPGDTISPTNQQASNESTEDNE